MTVDKESGRGREREKERERERGEQESKKIQNACSLSKCQMFMWRLTFDEDDVIREVVSPEKPVTPIIPNLDCTLVMRMLSYSHVQIHRKIHPSVSVHYLCRVITMSFTELQFLLESDEQQLIVPQE